MLSDRHADLYHEVRRKPPGEDVFAFVVAGGHGAELFEFADGAFDGVALLVVGGVEAGWSAAPATAAGAVGLLIGPLGNGRADAASAQVGADVSTGVGLVGADAAGSGAGTAPAAAADADGGHQGLEGHRVVALAGSDDPG